jgi:hypothetical protein
LGTPDAPEQKRKETTMPRLEIVDQLVDHFGRTWQELRGAILKTPAEEWLLGTTDYLIPARLAYHIVFSADLYAIQMGYEEYKPHRKYMLDWECASEDLPSREDLFGFINETEATVKQWLIDLGDEGLLEAETQYRWTGKLRLGRALYALRHNQWHIAEINTILRERGLDPGDW